jgi:catechol 2,3-dioxygenase-like lactoylglutathione lyase family enzyme
MISHVTLGVRDIGRAMAFYDEILASLDYARTYTSDVFIGYGDPETKSAVFWICLPYDGQPASTGNGTHVAFNAPNRAAVDAFHKLAIALGGKDEGAPGLRLHYTPTYYAAYVRDLDGNKLQAACRKPE